MVLTGILKNKFTDVLEVCSQMTLHFWLSMHMNKYHLLQRHAISLLQQTLIRMIRMKNHKTEYARIE